MTIDQLEREAIDLFTRGDAIGGFLRFACGELVSVGMPHHVLVARPHDLYRRLRVMGRAEGRDEVVAVLNAFGGYASPSARLPGRASPSNSDDGLA